MIRVAFLLNFSKEYKGGINYIKNLLYTNSITKFQDIEFYVFVPSNIEQEYIDFFSPYAKIIYTNIFEERSGIGFLNKVFNKLFNVQVPLLLLFKKYRINVVSHSFFWGNYKSLKIVNWIPDFQCLHYPELWPEKQLKIITNINTNIVNNSDIVILSSYDALNDFKGFAPSHINKARVLQFVSQPGEVNDLEGKYSKIKEKYKLGEKFFYLPNQFWSHKNHMVVLRAINLLVKSGINPLIITTGVMDDFRGNNKNLLEIKSYIQKNNLESNILLLGLIPYNEVLILMRKCIAVINPSFFEGWSSTIEEAKSIGKPVIISDIPVHREQNPNNVIFFDPNNESELSEILGDTWNSDYLYEQSEHVNESLKKDLLNRTIAFSNNYYTIIKDLVGNN